MMTAPSPASARRTSSAETNRTYPSGARLGRPACTWANWPATTVAVAMLAAAACNTARSQTAPGEPAAAMLRPANSAEVRPRVLDWLAKRGAGDAALAKIAGQWDALPPRPDGETLLAAVAQSAALVEPRAGELLEVCRLPHRDGALPDVAWLDEPGLGDFIRDQLRLLYGSWLAQERLYDEAYAELVALDAARVIDPGGLLFYLGAAQHWLLLRDAGLKTLSRLTADVADLPIRYRQLAELMRRDLEQLEDESLDHIARRMNDVTRRLELGRAGGKTRQVEDGIIDSLDKLIEDLEKQQQQQQAAAAAGGSGGSRNVPTGQPAQDSRLLGGKGPGEIDKKEIGSRSGWGDLPPRERQEALQQLGRDFPSHYREVVEQYFRRLASQSRPRPEE